MTQAYELAELIRDAARRVCRAENLCDAAPLYIESIAPLCVSLAGVRLPSETVSVCTGAADKLSPGCTALALKAAGGQRYYIIDLLSREDL